MIYLELWARVRAGQFCVSTGVGEKYRKAEKGKKMRREDKRIINVGKEDRRGEKGCYKPEFGMLFQ